MFEEMVDKLSGGFFFSSTSVEVDDVTGLNKFEGFCSYGRVLLLKTGEDSTALWICSKEADIRYDFHEDSFSYQYNHENGKDFNRIFPHKVLGVLSGSIPRWLIAAAQKSLKDWNVDFQEGLF